MRLLIILCLFFVYGSAHAKVGAVERLIYEASGLFTGDEAVRAKNVISLILLSKVDTVQEQDLEHGFNADQYGFREANKTDFDWNIRDFMESSLFVSAGMELMHSKGAEWLTDTWKKAQKYKGTLKGFEKHIYSDHLQHAAAVMRAGISIFLGFVEDSQKGQQLSSEDKKAIQKLKHSMKAFSSTLAKAAGADKFTKFDKAALKKSLESGRLMGKENPAAIYAQQLNETFYGYLPLKHEAVSPYLYNLLKHTAYEKQKLAVYFNAVHFNLATGEDYLSFLKNFKSGKGFEVKKLTFDPVYSTATKFLKKAIGEGIVPLEKLEHFAYMPSKPGVKDMLGKMSQLETLEVDTRGRRDESYTLEIPDIKSITKVRISKKSATKLKIVAAAKEKQSFVTLSVNNDSDSNKYIKREINDLINNLSKIYNSITIEYSYPVDYKKLPKERLKPKKYKKTMSPEEFKKLFDESVNLRASVLRAISRLALPVEVEILDAESPYIAYKKFDLKGKSGYRYLINVDAMGKDHLIKVTYKIGNGML